MPRREKEESEGDGERPIVSLHAHSPYFVRNFAPTMCLFLAVAVLDEVFSPLPPLSLPLSRVLFAPLENRVKQKESHVASLLEHSCCQFFTDVVFLCQGAPRAHFSYQLTERPIRFENPIRLPILACALVLFTAFDARERAGERVAAMSTRLLL